MKKIIIVLFMLQLFVSMFYGLFYLRSANFYQLVFEDHSFITLGFDEDREAYDFFLNLVEENGLIVSRVVYPNNETTFVYTTDVTLGGRITLVDGELPTIGSANFISNKATGEEGQVGLIADIVPGHQIIIRDMHHPQNFGLDGRYQINTTNRAIIEPLIEQLRTQVHYVQLSEDVVSSRLLRTLFSLGRHDGLSTELHIIEFTIIFPTILICMLTTLIQYALKQIKSSAVFSIHGYSYKRILYYLSWGLIKRFSLASVVAYTGALFYFIYLGYYGLLGSFTRLFMLGLASLVAFYLCVVNGVAFLILQTSKVSTIIKGQKMSLSIQAFNHFSKLVFTGIFLFSLSITIANFIQVNERLALTAYWEKTENVFQIRITGQLPMDWDSLTRYDEQKVAFYHNLIAYHNGFMMDSGVVRMIDSWADEEDNWGAPVLYEERHLLDRIENVEISPGFLRINPIYTLEGENAYDQLILEDEVLNVLLPESLIIDEEAIQEVLLASYDKAERLNVIYVQDSQYYFSFDRLVRSIEGYRIRDPLGIVFSGPALSAFRIGSAITNSVYFVAETNQPFLEIEPLIHQHGLQSQIQFIESLYDDNVREIRSMQAHQVRLMGLLVLLVITNLSVAYNLIANYFERYKFEIFLKSTFGWPMLKQNKGFLITYFTYSIPLIVGMSWVLGWASFLVGISVLTLDIIAMLLFQRRLLKKSFSEIMKGER